MKKLSLLAGAVFALVLAACSDSAGGDDGVKEVVYKVKPNLKIDGNTIEYSGSVVIPAGKVKGGAANKIEREGGVFSVAGRDYDIPAFEMGQYEVTQRLYKAVMNDDSDAESEPSCCKGASNTVIENPESVEFRSEKTYVYSDSNPDEKDLRPVENVTWYDAVYFCNKLSEKTGKVPYYTITGITRNESTKAITSATVEKNNAANAEYGYRLPTEAEWEYAARGADPSGAEWGNCFAGKASSNIVGRVNSDLDSVGWYSYNTVYGSTGEGNAIYSSGNPGFGTHRVGLKAPVSENKKLYDMSGNVFEWCWDLSSGARVYRGGCWGDGANFCCVVNHVSNPPFSHYEYIGFRVVCSV